jgi:hypothetical protein
MADLPAGIYEKDPEPTRHALPTLRDGLARLAQLFDDHDVPSQKRIVFNYDNLAGRPRDDAAYAFAAEHGIKVMEVRPSAHRGLWRLVPDTPHVRPVSNRRPVERSTSRPREHRSGRGHPRRGPPSGDDSDPEPPQTDVDVVFLDALARFETLREFEDLAIRCIRKAAFLISIRWPR